MRIINSKLIDCHEVWLWPLVDIGAVDEEENELTSAIGLKNQIAIMIFICSFDIDALCAAD